MDLKNINILDLQSLYMQQDPTTQAMSSALTVKFNELAEEIRYCVLLARVDELDEDILDELAWELHIEWYDSTASIDVKRNLVKNSDKVHMYLGTTYAVEQVIEDYFGDGEVEEWFDYGGQPYHFRVTTSNVSVTGEEAARFTKAIETVKNKRSKLEQILISLSGDMDISLGSIVHIGDILEIRQVG